MAVFLGNVEYPIQYLLIKIFICAKIFKLIILVLYLMINHHPPRPPC